MRGLSARSLRLLPRPCHASNRRFIFSTLPLLRYPRISEMSTAGFQYKYVEDMEWLEDYRPGGYHPVMIDDRLHDRYRIVHKLGHGTFSTIWLALDLRTSDYVAVKVGIADAGRREGNILSSLSGEATTNTALSLIPVVSDRFDIKGPNGIHPCLVTAPERCSLMDAKEASDMGLFQLDVARSLAAQLVLAVSFVHAHGYCHGDLHLGNIILQPPSFLGGLSIDQLYAKFGAPRPESVVRVDGKPKASPGIPNSVVPPVWLGLGGDEMSLADARLVLGDFGVSFRPSSKYTFESPAPLVIRPPEALFEPNIPLTFAADIWSLGCTMFELLGHRSLFDGMLATEDYFTAQQVQLQGPMPKNWSDRWGGAAQVV